MGDSKSTLAKVRWWLVRGELVDLGRACPSLRGEPCWTDMTVCYTRSTDNDGGSGVGRALGGSHATSTLSLI